METLSCVTITSPIYVELARKTKKDKKVPLNLNTYRNLHYRLNSECKIKYAKIMRSEILKLKTILAKPEKIRLEFVLYKASNRKIDRSNFLSIIEKFFCDALVMFEVLIDDNDDYIECTTYKTGGVDKHNPRCEISIYY